MAINSHILSKEQVLIVGCGDIGRRLAGFLPSDAYSVTGVRRRVMQDEPGLHYLAADVTTQEGMAQALSVAPDVVVITMTPAARTDEGYRLAYVETCRALVTALQARPQPPRLLVFVSSTAVYGQSDGTWVDEASATVPEGFSGQRLLEAESLVRTSGLPHVVVRFSGIYGPGRQRLIEQVRQCKASDSAHFTNRLHADDAARVLAYLIERQRHQAIDEIYLASDSAPTPMRDVVLWLAEQLGVSECFAPEAVNGRGNKRCSNQRLLAAGFDFWYPDFRAGYAAVLANLQG